MRGIKRVAVWGAMLTKRYFKNPIIIFTILAIPLVVLALQFSTGKDEAAVKVALYVRESDELSVKAIDSLTDTEGSVVRFYQVDSEEKARTEVEKGSAVCAYIFPENFSEKVESFVKNDKSELDFNGHLIKCIQGDETNYTKITEEMIFASFYEKFANEILYEFMLDYKEGFGDEDWQIIRDYYDAYDIKAEFFKFEYMDGSENTLMKQQEASFLLLPVRGLILTLVLLAAMTGGIVAYRDREKGMFQSITANRRGMINYLYVLIPTTLTAIAGLIGIWFAKIWTDFSREIICMVLYVFLVTGVCNAIRKICCNGIRFASIIPLYLMFNLVFAPVFINLDTMIPQIKYLRFVLSVNYGLNCLYDTGMRSAMFVIGIVLLGLTHIGRETE